MKKIIALSLVLAAFTFNSQAQVERKKGKAEGDKKEMKNHRGDRSSHDGKMNKINNLSEAQKSQLKAIREEYALKQQRLDAQNLGEAQKKEQKKLLMEERRNNVASILTPEQKAQMTGQWKDKKGERTEGKKQHKKGHEKMKKELSLSDAQVQQLKQQHEAMKSRKMAIKNNESLSKEQKKTQMKALKAEAKTQRSTVLTAEQQAKWEAMKKEHKNNHSGKARK